MPRLLGVQEQRAQVGEAVPWWHDAVSCNMRGVRWDRSDRSKHGLPSAADRQPSATASVHGDHPYGAAAIQRHQRNLVL